MLESSYAKLPFLYHPNVVKIQVETFSFLGKQETYLFGIPLFLEHGGPRDLDPPCLR